MNIIDVCTLEDGDSNTSYIRYILLDFRGFSEWKINCRKKVFDLLYTIIL